MAGGAPRAGSGVGGWGGWPRADAAAHLRPGVSVAASGPPARSPAIRAGLPETAAPKRRPAGEPPQSPPRADDQVSTQAR